MIPKYPFVVVVHHTPGGNRPPVQQHNYAEVGSALAAKDAFVKERGVLKVSLVCVLDESYGPAASQPRRWQG